VRGVRSAQRPTFGWGREYMGGVRRPKLPPAAGSSTTTTSKSSPSAAARICPRRQTEGKQSEANHAKYSFCFHIRTRARAACRWYCVFARFCGLSLERVLSVR
jgi:hypothetical protein